MNNVNLDNVDLSTAQPNDTLFSMTLGGMVVQKVHHKDKKIEVLVSSCDRTVFIDFDGRLNYKDFSPTCFFQTTEYNFHTSRPEEWSVDWKLLEGNKIRVSKDGISFHVATLKKYMEDENEQFMCFPIDEKIKEISEKQSLTVCEFYKYAKMFSAKENNNIFDGEDVDWSKVPVGTLVNVSDKEFSNTETYSTEFFFGYFPNLECPYLVFDNDRCIKPEEMTQEDLSKIYSATGFKFIRLVKTKNN